MPTFEERIKRIDEIIEEMEILLDVIRDNIKEMDKTKRDKDMERYMEAYILFCELRD
jgi:predicted nucleotidyltransferase